MQASAMPEMSDQPSTESSNSCHCWIGVDWIFFNRVKQQLPAWKSRSLPFYQSDWNHIRPSCGQLFFFVRYPAGSCCNRGQEASQPAKYLNKIGQTTFNPLREIFLKLFYRKIWKQKALLLNRLDNISIWRTLPPSGTKSKLHPLRILLPHQLLPVLFFYNLKSPLGSLSKSYLPLPTTASFYRYIHCPSPIWPLWLYLQTGALLMIP